MAAALAVVDSWVALFEDNFLLWVIVVGARIIIIGSPLLLQTHGPAASLICTHAHRSVNIVEAYWRRAIAPRQWWPDYLLAKVDTLHPIILLRESHFVRSWPRVPVLSMISWLSFNGDCCNIFPNEVNGTQVLGWSWRYLGESLFIQESTSRTLIIYKSTMPWFQGSSHSTRLRVIISLIHIIEADWRILAPFGHREPPLHCPLGRCLPNVSLTVLIVTWTYNNIWFHFLLFSLDSETSCWKISSQKHICVCFVGSRSRGLFWNRWGPLSKSKILLLYFR